MAECPSLLNLLEALLFVAAQPVSVRRRAEVTGRSVEEVRAVLEVLQADEDRGLRVQAVAGDAFQMVANPRYADYIKKGQGPARLDGLSRALWETMAVVAYRQPVTLAEVHQWRDVDASRALRTLLRRGWVRVVGCKAAPGQPRTYGVTDAFLQALGLPGIRRPSPMAGLCAGRP